MSLSGGKPLWLTSHSYDTCLQILTFTNFHYASRQHSFISSYIIHILFIDQQNRYEERFNPEKKKTHILLFQQVTS